MRDFDKRPWGYWEEYLSEPHCRVKRLVVSPGKRFSLQKHDLREEFWVVVQGTGVVTLDSDTREVSVGDTIQIPKGQLHRLENVGSNKLVVIEVQLGVCREDDITRLEDDWGRK